MSNCKKQLKSLTNVLLYYFVPCKCNCVSFIYHDFCILCCSNTVVVKVVARFSKLLFFLYTEEQGDGEPVCT